MPNLLTGTQELGKIYGKLFKSKLIATDANSPGRVSSFPGDF